MVAYGGGGAPVACWGGDRPPLFFSRDFVANLERKKLHFGSVALWEGDRGIFLKYFKTDIYFWSFDFFKYKKEKTLPGPGSRFSLLQWSRKNEQREMWVVKRPAKYVWAVEWRPVFVVKEDKNKRRNRQKNMAHAGLEPATFALLARRSNQLS